MNNNTNPSYPTGDESLDQCIMGDDTQDPADAFLVQEQDEMDDDEHDQFLHDGEADGDALASAGMGTDEDYGCYGGDGD